MTIKLLAADVGFRSTGMAIFEQAREDWQLFGTKCVHTLKEHDGLVALDDVRRTEFMATGILNYYIENKAQGLICEIPNGGAQSASAQKCMAAATSMIAVIHLVLKCPVIWITPDQSRAAAGWNKNEQPPLPAGLSPEERKDLARLKKQKRPENAVLIAAMKLKDKARSEAKAARQKALKDSVMGAMGAKYPAITKIKKDDQEHIADACASFEAAKGARLARLLEQL